MTRNMWGGRFESGPSEILRQFNNSFAYDRELFDDDVEGSMAWARALGRAGVLEEHEVDSIIGALARVQPPAGDEDYEDVHSYVEAKLYDLIGPVAGKLHTGRSRNDQVATDLKLWLKKACNELDGLVSALCHVLAQRAVVEASTPMPGYTHLKQAEPVTFGHWCLAYVEMLRRDRSRLNSVLLRGDECPLGSGALAGTSVDVEREELAHSLGFARATANSLDAVSDRDFAADYLYCAALLLSHLSRLSEDLIFFTSDEAGYAELPDAFSTGSSRMPQKKNPDVLELVRGHAARSIGELTGLLSLLKGLPLAYDKDLQLDKEPLFRTRTVLATALPALTGLMAALKLNRQRMRAGASRDLLLATELTDALASRGIPFREAHELVSARVGEAMHSGKSLRQLGPTDKITALDLEAMNVDRALSRHIAFGGTSPALVSEAARAALQCGGGVATFESDQNRIPSSAGEQPEIRSDSTPAESQAAALSAPSKAASASSHAKAPVASPLADKERRR